jgi:hypothetical protein
MLTIDSYLAWESEMAVSAMGASANTQASQGLSSSAHHRHGGHRAASISDVGVPSASPASSGRSASGVGSKLDVKV